MLLDYFAREWQKCDAWDDDTNTLFSLLKRCIVPVFIFFRSKTYITWYIFYSGLASKRRLFVLHNSWFIFIFLPCRKPLFYRLSRFLSSIGQLNWGHMLHLSLLRGAERRSNLFLFAYVWDCHASLAMTGGHSSFHSSQATVGGVYSSLSSYYIFYSALLFASVRVKL